MEQYSKSTNYGIRIKIPLIIRFHFKGSNGSKLLGTMYIPWLNKWNIQG